MIVLGIDIGVTGAVAAVDSHGTCAIEDIPTVAIPGKRLVKRRVDALGLMRLVRQMVPAGEVGIALIEDVHAGIGPGSVARSSIADSRGRVEAVLELARFDVRAVQPATWKRWFGLIGKGKGDGLEKARTLYPLVGDRLRLAKHHNRADALLLAHYGQRTIA